MPSVLSNRNICGAGLCRSYASIKDASPVFTATSNSTITQGIATWRPLCPQSPAFSSFTASLAWCTSFLQPIPVALKPNPSKSPNNLPTASSAAW